MIWENTIIINVFFLKIFFIVDSMNNLKTDDYWDNFLMYEIFGDYIKKLLKNLRISNLKHSIEYRIVKKVYYEFLEYGIGIYANEVYKNLKIDKKKFYRIVDRLVNNELIKKEKKEGYIFLSIPDKHKGALFNLIKYMQNSNHNFLAGLKQMEGVLNGNPRFIKYKAILEFLNKNNLDALDRTKLLNLFLKYLSAIDNKTIVLYNEQKQKLLKIPYMTRFNSGKRLYEKIDQFYSLFENAASKYRDAVFLTLTLDAKRFKNIYIASKEISISLNRFMSYLKKKFKSKISYINIFEFNKSGMVHLHLVLFGFNWLMPQKILSKLWDKYGMGKIVYLYSLMYDENYGGYVFKRKKPKDAKDNDVSDYLIKYLKKAFYNKSELALYWLTNKRFYSYSRDLKEEEQKKIKIKAGWNYIGVFDNDLFISLSDNEFIEFMVYSINKLKKRGLLLPT